MPSPLTLSSDSVGTEATEYDDIEVADAISDIDGDSSSDDEEDFEDLEPAPVAAKNLDAIFQLEQQDPKHRMGLSRGDDFTPMAKKSGAKNRTARLYVFAHDFFAIGVESSPASRKNRCDRIARRYNQHAATETRERTRVGLGRIG